MIPLIIASVEVVLWAARLIEALVLLALALVLAGVLGVILVT
jgi:hypothetical protein